MDANPEAHEHARLQATRARGCASSATWWRPTRAVRRGRVPPDDRARARTRRRCSSTSASLLRPGGAAYVSTPERADARAARAREQLGQPVARARVPRRGVPRALRAALRARRAARPLPRPQAARARAGAARRLGPRARRARHHQAASTTASRRRSPPRDFALRARRASTGALDFLAVLPAVSAAAPGARSRSSCTRTCPTWRASAPGRSARSGCGRRSRRATCRCSTCSTAARRARCR